uniref:Uncharacterized protein n=1 Tax=Glossina brevipalpis TaxID=37001 RepID=A0A1A9W4R7_9MUSC
MIPVYAAVLLRSADQVEYEMSYKVTRKIHDINLFLSSNVFANVSKYLNGQFYDYIPATGIIHGDIVVPKFLAVNGPKGTYSHFCISRALQSFIRVKPKTFFHASSTGIRSPNLLPGPPTKKAISSSKSNNLQAPNTGATRLDCLRNYDFVISIHKLESLALYFENFIIVIVVFDCIIISIKCNVMNSFASYIEFQNTVAAAKPRYRKSSHYTPFKGSTFARSSPPHRILGVSLSNDPNYRLPLQYIEVYRRVSKLCCNKPNITVLLILDLRYN